MVLRPVPQAAVDLAKSYEKCRLTCFDTDGSGTPTIGWGSTRGLTMADVGHKTITQEAADALFDAEFRGDAAHSLLYQVGQPCVDAMTDNQYGAMVDFVFNEGVIGPTLRKLLQARRFDAVPPALSAYVYAKQPDGTKKKELGLVRRRNAEVELWSTDEPGTVDSVSPSSVLRQVSTPPAPSVNAATPLRTQPQFITAAATAVGTTGVAVAQGVQTASQGLAQVHDAIAPYAAHSVHLMTVQTDIELLLAVLAVATVAVVWLKHIGAKHESGGVPNQVATSPSRVPA